MFCVGAGGESLGAAVFAQPRRVFRGAVLSVLWSVLFVLVAIGLVTLATVLDGFVLLVVCNRVVRSQWALFIRSRAFSNGARFLDTIIHFFVFVFFLSMGLLVAARCDLWIAIREQLQVGRGAQLVPAHALHHEDGRRPRPQGIFSRRVLARLVLLFTWPPLSCRIL